MDQGLSIPGRGPFQDGQVEFLDPAGTELGAQPACGLGRAGKDHHPGHGTVQAMNHSQEHCARFAIPLFDPRFPQVEEANVAGLICLYQEPRGLIKSEQMVVLV